MKSIKPLSRTIQHKVLPHSPQTLFKFLILFIRHTHQNLLQPRNFRRTNLNRKPFPSQHIAEGQNITLRNNHGNAFGINGLDNSGTGDLVAAGTEAESGLKHLVVVVELCREVLVDVDVGVGSVFPMV